MTELRLTLREIRLIIERLVQANGVAPGLLFAVRDAAVVSAILPVAGFEKLSAEIAALAASPVKPATLREGEDGVLLGGEIDLCLDFIKRHELVLGGNGVLPLG